MHGCAYHCGIPWLINKNELEETVAASIRYSVICALISGAFLASTSPTLAGDEKNKTDQSSGNAYEFVTLGTLGGPMPNMKRGQPANLIIRKGEAHLVDVGDGAATRLIAAGSDFKDLKSIFISHIHFDHTGGLFGVLGLRLQTRTQTPLTIYGPPGTKIIVETLLEAMEPGSDSGYGVPGEIALDPASSVSVVELDDGSQIEVGDMKVTAVSNTHYSFEPGSDKEKKYRSLSYRFDLPSRSIVYSGDSGPSENLARLADGADLLVTEMIDEQATIKGLRPRVQHLSQEAFDQMVEHLTTHHLTTSDIGAMAAKANVGSVVVTHLAGGGDRRPGASARYVDEIHELYKGDVTIANDMERF